MHTCIVCGRETMENDCKFSFKQPYYFIELSEGRYQHVLQIPHIQKHLTPVSSHPAQRLWRGMLLYEQHLQEKGDDAADWACNECLRSLTSDRLPKYALTNDMWIGDIPPELAMLTLPEELLIARHYPKCYIVKLFPKEKRNMQPSDLQRAIRGNVTLYNMNSNDVVKMLEGQLMPQSVSSLSSILAITYIGTRKLPKDWLKSTFRVRRHVVHDALLWLKNHNPFYSDIGISMERLQDLPEDDVPNEISSIVRHENDENVAVRESEGYAPVDENLTGGKFRE